jgi:hypothetical protein
MRPLGPTSYMHHYIGPDFILSHNIMAVLEFEEKSSVVSLGNDLRVSPKPLKFLIRLKGC